MKETNEDIKKRMSRYLSEEQISELSNTELRALNEYLSNQQLRKLADGSVKAIKRIVAKYLKSVERQRLSIIPTDEVEEMLEYYDDIAEEIEKVVCENCETLIAIEIKHKTLKSTEYFNNPNIHWDDRFVIGVGNNLHGYRKRLDDVMGYRCGGSLKNPEYDEIMKKHEREVNKAKRAKKTPPKMPRVQEIISCGFQNVMSEPELEAIPEEHLKQSIISSSDIIKVKDRINKTNWKKPVEEVKDGFMIEKKFKLRKVK